MRIGKILRGAAVSGAAFLLTAGSVFAATTISANIATTGTLDVDGATTLDGNVGLGDAAADLVTVSGTIQGASPLVFEGATADLSEATFAFTEPTADRTFTFPDASLTVAGIDLAQSWSAAQTFNGGITAATFSVNPATKDPIAIAPLTGSTGDFTGTITSEDLSATRTWTLPNATGTFCLTSSCLPTSLTDDAATALATSEGANSYFAITTTNGSEALSFGNGTTNPDYTFFGSGLITTGDDLVISGDTLSFGSTGIISSSGTANLTVDTASTGTLNLGTGASAKGVHIGNTTADSEITMLSGTGAIRLNVSNNQPTNLNTGTSTGALSLGGGSGTVAIDSSDWDISTTGAITGVAFDANGTGNSLTNVDAADLTVDSLDFAQLADALTIDTASVSGTWTDLGSVTTVDINGGTLDGVTIGGASAAGATVTTLSATTSATIGSGTAITKMVAGNLADGSSGWVPDGASVSGFTITADAASVTATSLITVSLGANATATTCFVSTRTAATSFRVECSSFPADGATLQYGIINF